MRIRTFTAAAAVLVPLALAAPVAAARADAGPAASPLAASGPLLTFVPPRVGPITVTLGPTILGGQVIDPGLTVSTAGVSLPPMAMTVPQRHSRRT
ncbi:MAG TPA: hypothetical protein VE570_14555 [Thermoleophilaceae bacterium]|jgi:hypothetical protein|nr:hypothetical protein [Thermoleophilaceae bacterium]